MFPSFASSQLAWLSFWRRLLFIVANPKHLLDPVSGIAALKEVAIFNTCTGIEVGDCIGCADSSLTRLFGLLGKNTLLPGRGIWIRPSSGIHTFGMRFSIDVIGLDRDLRIVKLWPKVKPFRVTSIHLQVKSVIEMAEGQIAAKSLAIGHVLEIQPLHGKTG